MMALLSIYDVCLFGGALASLRVVIGAISLQMNR